MPRLAPALVLLLGFLIEAGPVAAQSLPKPSVLVVSRSVVLNESSAAQALARRELELTSRLQAEVDATKERLAEEEEELARLRPTLDRAIFEARAEDFRVRVQRERREAQSRAAALQKVFRDARRELVQALQPILEEVLASHGADVILNADNLLAARPGSNVTVEVLTLFNARVPVPMVEVVPPVPQDGEEAADLPLAPPQ